MNNYGLVVIGLLECIAIGWFFGTAKLKKYINEVSDFHIGWWWDLFIKWVTPLALGWALVANFVEEIRTPYEGYPTWALLAGGWGVVIVIIAVAALMTGLPWRNGKENG
jgi:NSS family neurotransmitter:Na+ symporter